MLDQHQINVQIAETLEELQELNPDLYGFHYSELYANNGVADPKAWTLTKLQQIQQDLINN